MALEAEAAEHRLALFVPPVVGRLGLIPQLRGPNCRRVNGAGSLRLASSCAHDLVAASSSSRLW